MSPSEQAVAAYYLWQKAGCPEGRDFEFWLQAYAEPIVFSIRWDPVKRKMRPWPWRGVNLEKRTE